MVTKKVINTLCVSIIALIISSCSSLKLEKTIWFNSTIVEKDGSKSLLTTSLYFLTADTVDIYSSVRKDTLMIVKPFKYASGTYTTSGNPKHEAQIWIEATSIDNKKIKFEGAYHKAKAMYLISQDSIVKVYGKLPKVVIP